MIKTTERIRREAPEIPFGMLVIHGVTLKAVRQCVKARERAALEAIQENEPRNQANLEAYARFFDAWGYPCPLPGQVQAIRAKGVPSAPALVQALLLCEASQGVLMGVQDWDLVRGDILWDLADPHEKLDGIKGTIRTKAGEPVFRDGLGILASYFQGPDRRIAVCDATHSVVFLALGAPGMSRTPLKTALEAAREILEGAFNRLEGPMFVEDGQVDAK